MQPTASAYPGWILEDTDEDTGFPPVTDAAQDRPALADFLEREVESDGQVLSAMLRLVEARFAPERATLGRAVDEGRLRSVIAARVQGYFAQHAAMEQVSFAAYLHDICDELAETLAVPGRAKLTCRASEAMLPAPKAVWLGLVAGELIILALKYGFRSGRGGRVDVGFAAAPAGWELAVEDTGTVMDVADDRRIACLAVVRALVKQLGGRLDVASVIGGNRLTVTLARH